MVVACGNCASNGVPFFDCYNVEGGIDRVIPVDVYVPGCACRPEAIIDGVVLAISKWKEKMVARSAMAQRRKEGRDTERDRSPYRRRNHDMTI